MLIPDPSKSAWADRIVELVDLVDPMLINALVKDRAQQRHSCAGSECRHRVGPFRFISGFSPRLTERTSRMLPSAGTSSSEMKPSTTPTPRYFVSSAVSVKDAKRCLQHRRELLRIHTVIGRMDVDEEPTGRQRPGLRDWHSLAACWSSIAIVAPRCLPLLIGDVALNERAQTAGQVLRHRSRLQRSGRETKA